MKLFGFSGCDDVERNDTLWQITQRQRIGRNKLKVKEKVKPKLNLKLSCGAGFCC